MSDNPQLDRPQIDIAALRKKLSSTGGKQYWRSLEELAATPEFQIFLDHEFPQHSEQWQQSEFAGGVNRRQLLSVMGASLAMAGLSACTRASEDKIVPYVQPPEIMVPGKPLYYATTFTHGGFGTGVLVTSNMGRPTKIEGNPDHPASLGATDAITQASLLTLYDPDRSQTVLRLGNISNWQSFAAWLSEQRNALAASKGAGVHILTEPITSPTLADQMKSLLAQWPQAKWHVYEPAGRENIRQGSQLAFGDLFHTLYHFDQAMTVLSLGSDFLLSGAGSVPYARQFAAKRRDTEHPNRLYVAETTPTSTGAVADHRLAVGGAEMELFTRALAAALDGKPVPAGKNQKWITAVARDLKKNAGSSIVIAGDEQPPMVHALAHQINQSLGNVGKTVTYTASIESVPATAPLTDLPLSGLNDALKAGQVDLLFVIGSNPRYTAPADLDFKANFGKARQVVQYGLFQDETAEYSHWHLPSTHYLEEWGDARAFDGTVSLVQPLIAPLYDGRSVVELMALLLGKPGRPGYEIVRDYWQGQRLGGGNPSPEPSSTSGGSATGGFEAAWRKALHDGFIPQSAAAVGKTPALKTLPASDVGTTPAGALELVFRPDPSIGDGRYANNGWLQELPKAVTRLTWDAAAHVSPSVAERLKLANGDKVNLTISGRTLKAPVWVTPGQAENSVTVTLGYGRWRAGRVGNGLGFNAYELRTSTAPWFASGLEIHPLGYNEPMGATHTHHGLEGKEMHGMEGRAPVRIGTYEEFEKNPGFVQKEREAPPPSASMFPMFTHEPYGWGMAVDLSSCNGCNACVVACQSENNIPVVGKDQVIRGREMHWIRIDRYYEGPVDNPDTHFQPVMCQQCENAPCEIVCPVGATVHDEEGINNMVYNRCVGTRYCSNNCPYKVRRFNFLAYQDWETASLEGMRNPNVSVRSRGVMEKCTFCIQRISLAKIEAEKEDRTVRDGEIQTACQQVCPAQAITFGNIRDPQSKVSKLKTSQLNYGLLEELHTRPRTTYLARLRNPNPELHDEKPAGEKG